MAIVAAVVANAFVAGGIGATAWIMAGIATAFQVGMYLYQQSQFNTDSSSPNYTFGPIQNTKTQKLPVPVVYGEMLVAGNIFYEKFKDDKCEEVDRFFGVSVGPVESITAVKIGDKLVEECEGCTWTKHLYTDSSTTDPLDPSGIKPYPIDNINNIAFISMHLKAGEDVSGSDVITSIAKGKKVWTPNGTVWSNNPAWCIYDLLTNTVYGCGIPADRIDLASFTTAAAYYDAVIPASGKKRFTLNYVIDTQKKAIDILGDMLAVCFSSLISREKIRLVPDAPVVSYSKRIGMADIKDGSFQWTQKSESERYNRIVVEWCDPDNSYEQVVSIFEDTADQAQRGVIEQSVNMLGCTNVDQANRTGARILDSCMGIKEFCKCKMSLKNASVEVGDVVAFSHDVPGWTDKWMRVIGITDVDNIEDEIEVTFAEYVAEVYDDVPMNVPVHIDTGIHGVYVPDNVSNITFTEQLEVQTDGTYIDWISVQWTNPSQNFSHLEMWYRFDSEANYTAGGNVSKTATEWRVNATSHSRLYVKIVTVGGTGKRSSGLSAMHTITGDVTPPAAPTNLTGTGGYKLANLKWTDPADADLDHVDVYRSSDGSSYAVTGRSTRGKQAFIDTNLGILTNYWYKLKAVDSAGNESAFSAVAQVMTESIPPADIPDFSIDEKKTVSDVFGDTKAVAVGVIEQVLNNYGDTKRTVEKIETTNSALEITQGILAEAGVKIDDLETTTEQTVSRLGNAEQRITTAEGVLDEAVADITTLTQRVGEAEQDITDVNVVVAGHTASISSITQRVGAAEQGITTLQETTATQATHLTQLDQKTDTTNTNVSNLTTTVAGHTTNIGQITQRVSDAESNISALETATSQQGTAISGLTTRVNSAEQNISTLQETTATQATSLQTVTQRVTTAESNISTLETATSQQGTAISGLSTRVTTAEGDISALETSTTQQGEAISGLTTRVTTTEQDITTLEETTAQQATALQSVTQRVTTAENDIVAVEQDVTNLQQTTSAQATQMRRITQSIGRDQTAEGLIEQVLNNYGDTKRASQSFVELNELTADQATHLTQLEQSVGATQTTLTELTQTVDGQSTHLTQLDSKTDTTNTSVAQLSSIVDGLNAKWYVKVDSNGKIAGISLGNDSQSSDFTVLADKLFIYGTGTGGSELKQVFAVDTTTGKVVLQGDLLADGSITGAKINAAAQITLGNGGQLIMGAGSVLQMASGAVVLDSEAGTLQIRDANNLVTGDYIRIETGNIVTYKYYNGQYRPERQLSKVESGIVANGTTVTLEGYYDQFPAIQLSPASLQSYNKDYSTQNQTLVLSVQNPTISNNRVSFTARATLAITGSSTRVTTPIKYYVANQQNKQHTISYTLNIPQNAVNIRIKLRVSTVHWSYADSVGWTDDELYAVNNERKCSISMSDGSTTTTPVVNSSMPLWFIQTTYTGEDGRGAEAGVSKPFYAPMLNKTTGEGSGSYTGDITLDTWDATSQSTVSYVGGNGWYRIAGGVRDTSRYQIYDDGTGYLHTIRGRTQRWYCDSGMYNEYNLTFNRVSGVNGLTITVTTNNTNSGTTGYAQLCRTSTGYYDIDKAKYKIYQQTLNQSGTGIYIIEYSYDLAGSTELATGTVNYLTIA